MSLCFLQVETILGRRYSSGGGIEYLIRWRGYNSDWDTWEPAENLDCAQEAVEEFNSRIPLSSTMAANRPARTIKPPSKFLDTDLQVASVNGVPNHAETTGNVLSAAARKLSRSVSLTKDEGKTKISPKRRASSIEVSADEEEKSSGKLSRQNSVSPSAKIKAQRTSGFEETQPVNGVEIVTGKEQFKSVKVNHVLNKGKVSPGARRQSISKSRVVEGVGTDSSETVNETVTKSPSKLDTDQRERNSDAIYAPGEDIDTKAPKRNRAKFSPTKLREKTVNTDSEIPENTNECESLFKPKKRGKPGPKPKQKINTKKLKTVVNKGKSGFAKTPKATADRVKRKYAQKKSTFANTDTPKSSILEGTAETLNENETHTAESTAQKTVRELVASIARKRKPLKVVKLSTKPGKGRLSTKSALKMGKPTKQVAGKSTEVTEQKLAVKRPRLKPGPKPKKQKLPIKSESNTVDMNLKADDYSKGYSVKSSTEKVIRYKLDGSPCLKPGPKPKNLTDGDSESGTTSQLTPVGTGRNSMSKGKPGPKPKKPATTENSEMQDTSSITESFASKGRKTSCERTEEVSMSPKSTTSPKVKKDIVDIRTEQRKKPGPKPRKALSEPVKIDLSNEDASKIKEGAKDSMQQVENVDETPNSQTGKGKPKTKPKKNITQDSEAKTSMQQVENVNKTPNSQTSKGKPKTKPKKNVTQDSEMATENIKRSPTKLPNQELNVSDNSSSSQKVRGKLGPKPKKTSESSPSVGGSPGTAKKKVSKKSMPDSGEMDDGTNFIKVRKTESNVEKTSVSNEPEKKKTISRSKKVENEAEGSVLSKSKATVKAKSDNSNVGTSFPSTKLSTKSKNVKNDTSPVKGKPGPKPKRPLPENIKSTKLSPSKLNTKRAGKKLKKTVKRSSSFSTTDRQNSTSDESDTLYSLNEPERKKFRFDQTDSATSSDSEVVLKKPKEMKTSPSPRKMLLKDSIRPKNIDSETGK